MTAAQFEVAFRCGWLAAGKVADTREYQLAVFSAWCGYVGIRS